MADDIAVFVVADGVVRHLAVVKDMQTAHDLFPLTTIHERSPENQHLRTGDVYESLEAYNARQQALEEARMAAEAAGKRAQDAAIAEVVMALVKPEALAQP